MFLYLLVLQFCFTSFLSGTSILQLVATDPDGPDANISYYIDSGARDNFVLNKLTGVLMTSPSANLDRDLYGNSYNILVYSCFSVSCLHAAGHMCCVVNCAASVHPLVVIMWMLCGHADLFRYLLSRCRILVIYLVWNNECVVVAFLIEIIMLKAFCLSAHSLHDSK